MSSLLTSEQKKYLKTRNITPRSIAMFPRWGFNIYNKDKESGRINNNPLFKSLDHEFFYIKEITKNGFVRGNFYKKPIAEDFYLRIDELSKREIIEKIMVSIIFVPLFLIKNLYINKIKKEHG